LNEQQLLQRFASHAPGFLGMLGARFVAADPLARSCAMTFDISTDFCHSGDIVQGGFVTAMLDAVMTHAVFASESNVLDLSSLEIKTNYLEATRAGRLRAEGMVIKSGYKLAFLEGRLYNSEGVLTATSSTVAKLIRAKAAQ
jgi:uncharacterized protein (TIGR00369 family)